MRKRSIALWACLLIASASFANTHKVVSGDNDHKIAQKYHITVSQLHSLNPNVDWKHLKIGANLVVSKETPKPASKPASKPAPKPAPKPATKPAPKPTEKPATAPDAAKPSDTKPATIGVMLHTANAKISTDRVNLRGKPTTSSASKGLLDKGSVGRIVGRDKDWYKLEFAGGVSGWVRGDMLAETSNPISSIRAILASTGGSTGGNSASVDAVLSTARSCIGVRYVYGGTSRAGFDCSGFVGHVFRAHGINLPRTAAEQWTRGTYVSRTELRAGDLIFFHTRGARVSHVGIYIGGNRFIHASSGGGLVRVNELTGYYSERYVGAKRVLRGSTTVASLDTRFSDVPITEPSFDPEPEVETPKSTMGSDVVTK